jgi:pimeloyl-ACP methyl ester carboxylesterase
VLRETDGRYDPEPRDPVPDASPPRQQRNADQLRPAPMPAWPGELVDLPAGPLFVRRGPAGPDDRPTRTEPAVLVHGLGGSSTNWTDLIDLLSWPDDERPDVPVLECSALDLPGFGFSPPPADGDYRIAGHARAVIDLIEKQGNWPVHLIGNSMGGAVATRVAGRRPDLVRTLILISPAMPDLRPRPLPLRLSLVALPGVGKAIMDWLGHQPADRRADQLIGDVFKDPGVVRPERREEEIAELVRRDGLDYASTALILSARSLVGEYFKAGRTTLWRDAVRTRAPALVIYGSHDKLVNPVMAARAARTYRGARVLVLPGVGHVAMMERSRAVSEEIRSFLAALARPGRRADMT